MRDFWFISDSGLRVAFKSDRFYSYIALKIYKYDVQVLLKTAQAPNLTKVYDVSKILGKRKEDVWIMVK
jgi:hypothetical protein